MIAPADITVTPLPGLADTVVPVIDAAVQTWDLLETTKEVEIVWDQHGGFTPAKANSLLRIASGYRKKGWRVTVNPRSSASHFMIFELPI